MMYCNYSVACTPCCSVLSARQFNVVRLKHVKERCRRQSEENALTINQ
jgi:hypothetical protein